MVTALEGLRVERDRATTRARPRTTHIPTAERTGVQNSGVLPGAEGGGMGVRKVVVGGEGMRWRRGQVRGSQDRAPKRGNSLALRSNGEHWGREQPKDSRFGPSGPPLHCSGSPAHTPRTAEGAHEAGHGDGAHRANIRSSHCPVMSPVLRMLFQRPKQVTPGSNLSC